MSFNNVNRPSCSSSFDPSFGVVLTSEAVNPAKRQRIMSCEGSLEVPFQNLQTPAFFISQIETQIAGERAYNDYAVTLLKESFVSGCGKEVVKSLTKTFAFGTRFFTKNPSVVASILEFATMHGLEVESLANRYRSNCFGKIEKPLLHFSKEFNEYSTDLTQRPSPVCTFISNEDIETPVKHLIDVLTMDNFISGLTVDCLICEEGNHEVTFPLSGERLQAVLQVISSHPTLISACFSGHSFTDVSAPIFSKFITCMSLKDLSFDTVSFSFNGASQIFDAMASNTSLTSLNLTLFCDDDGLDANGTTVALACAEGTFKRMIIENTTLMKLHLEEYSFSNVGNWVAQTLHLNKALTHVALHECGLSEDSIFRILQVVENSKLVSLDLGRNNFSNRHCVQVGTLLRNNSTLQELYLSVNKGANIDPITENSANLIAGGLSANKTLKVLDLSFHNIPIESKIKIAEALERNHTLEAIVLDELRISDQRVLEAFERALKYHPSITKISLRWQNHNRIMVDTPRILNLREENMRNRLKPTVSLYDLLLPVVKNKQLPQMA